MRKSLLIALALGACSSDDGTTNAQKDAAGSGSGSNTAAAVQKVTCTGTPPKVTADAAQMTKFTYSTGATLSINVGDVVEFQMPANHNVRPSSGTDSALSVDFGGDVCFKFTKAGTYSFYCQPHGFAGSLTVN